MKLYSYVSLLYEYVWCNISLTNVLLVDIQSMREHPYMKKVASDLSFLPNHSGDNRNRRQVNNFESAVLGDDANQSKLVGVKSRLPGALLPFSKKRGIIKLTLPLY